MFWSGTRYSLLSSGSGSGADSGTRSRFLHLVHQFQRHVLRKRVVLGTSIFVFFAVIISCFPYHRKSQLFVPSEALRTPKINGFEIPDAPLRLVIPATTSNPNLCKAILSSTILNFTAPTIVNWGQGLHRDNWETNASHINKITGTLAYLDALKQEHDHELVLIADGFDSWFQFGPEVIKSRYAKITKSLHERTKAMIGELTFRAEGLTQSIVFSAQKDCGPNMRLDDIGCYGQIESPLSKDLYGPDTDVLDPKMHLPLHFRPHFLCSGVIIGTVQDLRKMFVRATEKIDTMPHRGSDQDIFNQIYGEQNYQREVMRLRHRTLWEEIRDDILKVMGRHRPSITDPHPTRKPMESHDGAPLDFGIGLDYGQEISHSTVLSEWDSRWLTMANVKDAHDQQRNTDQRVKRVPGDVLEGPPPFIGLPGNVGKSHGKITSKWNELSLYSHLYTGSMPAIIHMNGLKSMRETSWDKMWYHEERRNMLSAMTRDVGAWTVSGEWLSWDELCRGTEDEVFRDSLGPWKKEARKEDEKVERRGTRKKPRG
ncbi:hypothetical protein ONS95_012990 [Cadophora gregata]|uniref:uncharacterized protein n=1 Tax=Cadophora gregata TaxID=51156 RepID=UPI0026DC10F3|nr:uncharacterized protein ONS95_012990 [Cadophora gregata]KAK0101022.1 hypothetical protein ONS96_006253 [Cadophora gregata f. sp. sojae]KAK0115948.1 hypothetical protein ONS95_012990 [Cadophora gregata]